MVRKTVMAGNKRNLVLFGTDKAAGGSVCSAGDSIGYDVHRLLFSLTSSRLFPRRSSSENALENE